MIYIFIFPSLYKTYNQYRLAVRVNFKKGNKKL